MAFPYKSILLLCISSALQANEETQEVALIKKPPQTEVQKTERQVLAGTHTPENEPACDLGSRAIQISARHVQGAGVGYSRGYTTLEGFLSPSRCYEQWTPFIDLRGHVFNNAKLAANSERKRQHRNCHTCRRQPLLNRPMSFII